MEADSTKEMKTEEVISDGVDEVSSCSSSHVPLQPCRVSAVSKKYINMSWYPFIGDSGFLLLGLKTFP